MDETSTELMNVDSGTVALLNRSEIDMQIATAHKYPRSVAQFRKNVFNMVALSEQVASECIYAVPRDGKMIEGPSARFAEVVASAWGNSRAGARVVSDQGEFVTAQGVFHDLEQNVAITYEVQRRIINKSGRRFSADMIGVTANAACSIALRNAILKGIPKAYWVEMYDGARKMALGDTKTLPTRRADVLGELLRLGVSPEMVYAKLGIVGKEDLGLEQLGLLKFTMTAIKDGDTTAEQAFAPDDATTGKPAVKMPAAKAPPTTTMNAAAEDRVTIVDQATGEIKGPHSAPVSASAMVKVNLPSSDGENPPWEIAKAAMAPAGEQSRPAGNAALASEGERKFIINRARSNGVEMAQLMIEAGISGLPADLKGLTVDGFTVLKEALAQH